MAIVLEKIRVSNFKSIKEIELDLGNFNVLIGANASGKSNIISVLRFMKDVMEHGLSDAISMQGGIEYIRNINLGTSQDLIIGLEAKSVINALDGWVFRFAPKNPDDSAYGGFVVTNISYLVDVKFYKSKYRIHLERLEAKGQVNELELNKSKERFFPTGKSLGEGKIVLIRDKEGNISHEIDIGNSVLSDDSLWSSYRLLSFPLKELTFIGKPAMFSALNTPLSYELGAILDSLSFFDIDPKSSRKSTSFSGKTELESDGSNLAIVLKDILEHKGKRKRFFTIIRQILPFVENVTIKKFVDKSLIPCLQESYCGKEFLPAPWISDGTISVITLVIALFFGESSVVVLEEPERNIHPALLAKLMTLSKDTSRVMRKQVIITTHNPQIVKYSGIESLLLVQRDADSYSIVTKPKDSEEVKAFLKNDLGVDDLFVRNLLE